MNELKLGCDTCGVPVHLHKENKVGFEQWSASIWDGFNVSVPHELATSLGDG